MSEENEICKRIRTLRLQRQLTQEALGMALNAGTPQSGKAMIAKIEAGQVPGGVRLQKLAQALGSSLDYLLTGTSQDLFELVRFTVVTPSDLDAAALQVFRAARLFLYFSLAATTPVAREEFLDVANRLFFLAQHAPDACAALTRAIPTEPDATDTQHDPREVNSLPELLAEIWETLPKTRAKRYAAFHQAEKWATAITERLQTPARPPLPETGSNNGWTAHENPPHLSGQRAAVILIPDNSLEPLARKGQYAVLAEESRTPEEGDLVACRTQNGALHLGRYMPADKMIHLMPLSPQGGAITHLDPDDCAELRVIRGVLFE